MARHEIQVSIDRQTITVDGKPLDIETWPENDIALTAVGGFYTAGPNVGYEAEPCSGCGEAFISDERDAEGNCPTCQAEESRDATGKFTPER